ncbi:hypothetical protein D3C80_1947630 [compost metagenome]
MGLAQPAGRVQPGSGDLICSKPDRPLLTQRAILKPLPRHENHINPVFTQSFQTVRRDPFIDNNHINALRINNFMQT